MSGRSREELLRLGNTQSLQITLEGEANKNRLDSLKRNQHTSALIPGSGRMGNIMLLSM